MTIKITTSVLEGLNTSVRRTFMRAYEGATSWHKQLCAVVPSDSGSNTYPLVIDPGAVREWESGERIVRSLQLGSYQIFNKRYEKTLGINRDQLADDATGALMMRARMLGEKFTKHPDRMVANIFADNPTGLDGVALFHATHQRNPVAPDGNTFSNLYATRPLTKDNLAYVRSKMLALLGPDGEPLNNDPRLIIVPPELEDVAMTLAYGQYIANTAGATPAAGTTMVENVMRGKYDVLVIQQLSAVSVEDWYLADVSTEDKPFLMQPRDPLELVTQFAPTDPGVFMRNEYIWGATIRYGFGPGSPYRIAKGDAS
jgi:phage major head subunit gpT-like protein